MQSPLSLDFDRKRIGNVFEKKVIEKFRFDFTKLTFVTRFVFLVVYEERTQMGFGITSFFFMEKTNVEMRAPLFDGIIRNK